MTTPPAIEPTTILVKPTRPYTEYNIFFQLEREYILQVQLSVTPDLEPTNVFHPTHDANYKGPALPPRYADLTLPSDWYVPGKEKRRKRKHRKTHGKIGFHELSLKIADAWGKVDEKTRSFCAELSDVGMLAYKKEMRKYKLAENKIAKARRLEAAKKEAMEAAIKKKEEKEREEALKVLEEAAARQTQTPSNVFCSEVSVNSAGGQVHSSGPVGSPVLSAIAVPNSVFSGNGMGSVNGQFSQDGQQEMYVSNFNSNMSNNFNHNNSMNNIGNVDIVNNVSNANNADNVDIITNLHNFNNINNLRNARNFPRSSIRNSEVSNQSDDTVDMCDSEIIGIWKQQGTHDPHCQQVQQVQCGQQGQQVQCGQQGQQGQQVQQGQQGLVHLNHANYQASSTNHHVGRPRSFSSIDAVGNHCMNNTNSMNAFSFTNNHRDNGIHHINHTNHMNNDFRRSSLDNGCFANVQQNVVNSYNNNNSNNSVQCGNINDNFQQFNNSNNNMNSNSNSNGSNCSNNFNPFQKSNSFPPKMNNDSLGMNKAHQDIEKMRYMLFQQQSRLLRVAAKTA